MNLLDKTYKDPDGSLSIPELAATGAALIALVGGAVSVWQGHFDVQAFGIGAGAIVAALGAAQRLRDGLYKGDDQR